MTEDSDFPDINRALLVIQVKQPYVDWTNNLPDRHESEIKQPHTLERINDEPAAYLIPKVRDNEKLDAFVTRKWAQLFEMQLSGWTTDQSLWPKSRTRKMFNDWFDVKISSLIFDLSEKEPLGYNEY